MKISVLLLLMFTVVISYSQGVGIGTTAANPNAVLDVKSGNKGILVPRMDSFARKNIPNTKGLMVYDTTSNSFWFNTGIVWLQVGIHHFIGERFGGGVVFLVDATGEHGLIASLTDQNPAIRWFGGTLLGTVALGDGPRAGISNTDLIISNQGYGDGGSYAARVCHELSIVQNGDTYSDWYLPSKFELNLLFQNRLLIGGFALMNYWSSTEVDTNLCWSQDFATGGQNLYIKNQAFNVRAIRSF